MKKLIPVLFLLLGIAAYLYYVQGWDWQKAKEFAVKQTDVLHLSSATSTPIGSRGSGIHWETAASMPSARSEAGAAAIGGVIYVAGGIDGYGRTMRSLETYDVKSDSWSEAPLMPQAVHHAATVTDGGSLFVIGGLVGVLSFQPLDSAYGYNPAAHQWIELSRLNDFRGGGAAVAADGKIWYIGGLGQAGPTNAMEVYDIARNVWTVGRSMPTARDHLAAALVGRKIYVMGGNKGTPSSNMDVVEVYDIDKDAWSAGPRMRTPRAGFAAAVVDDRIYAFGGEAVNGTVVDVDVLDTKKNAWLPAAPPMSVGRHDLTAAASDGRIYVMGGGKRPGFSVSSLNEALILGK